MRFFCSENKISSRIHPNTLKFYGLPKNAAVTKVSPRDLLSSRRLDVVARVLYARERLSDLPPGWGCHVFESLIRCWTNDFTPPREVEPGRFTMDDYHQQFSSLIDSMAAHRFSEKVSLIPTCKGTLVDGAHRLAAAVTLGLDEVATVELDGIPQVQNYQTLLQIGMESAAVESLVLELVRLKEGSRIALLFPCASQCHENAVQFLEKEFLVDYQCDMLITLSGLKRLMDLCYGSHDWWGDVHAFRFAKRRFSGRRPLKIVCFQEDGKSVRSIKEKLRDLMGCGNDAIHTTDTHEETLIIAEVLLNEHGRNWLNVANNTPTPRFDMLFDEFRRRVFSEQAATRVCVDAGGVLAAHGLRDVTDLDYLEVGGQGSFDRGGEINCHNGEYDGTGISESNIVSDFRMHFYYRGIRFAALPVVESLKMMRGSQKDLDDVARMKSLHAGLSYATYLCMREFKTTFKKNVRQVQKNLFLGVVATAKAIVPGRYHPLARRLYFLWCRQKNQ